MRENFLLQPALPAIEVARWAADTAALIDDTRIAIDSALRRHTVVAKLSYLRSRWTSGFDLIREFLEESSSGSAVRLLDRLDDVDEFLGDCSVGHQVASLADLRQEIEDHLQAAQKLLEIAACKAFSFVQHQSPGQTFVDSFDSYRRMLEGLAVPKLTVWQRRHVFKALKEIDDLHDSIAREL